MTLSELRTLAASDAASTDPRRRKAGEWAQKAIAALEKKDWTAAVVALARAIVKRPVEYAEAFRLLASALLGASTSPKKAAASRENGKKGAAHGKKGGRPRLYPEGCREHARRARKGKGSTGEASAGKGKKEKGGAE